MQTLDLWEIEEQLWTAGADFYEQHLDPGAVIVTPTYGPLNRTSVLAHVRAHRFTTHATLNDRESLAPAANVAVLTYNVNAIRLCGEEHRARCTSTYVRVEGKWRLALHHQTKEPTAEREALGSLASNALNAAAWALRL